MAAKDTSIAETGGEDCGEARRGADLLARHPAIGRLAESESRVAAKQSAQPAPRRRGVKGHVGGVEAGRRLPQQSHRLFVIAARGGHSRQN